MRSFWAQVWEITRKDLVIEGRAGEVVNITVPFGAVAMLLIPLAIGTDLPLLEQVGPGLFWVVTLLFGMMVAFRQTAAEGKPQRELLALLGVDPAAGFVGRALANTVLLLVFEAILAPIAILLYNPTPVEGWALVIVAALLVAVGIALVGTLAAGMTVGLRTRNTLAPLLVAPLSLPLLVGSTQIYEALRSDGDPRFFLGILVATDLALAIVGVMTANASQEAAL